VALLAREPSARVIAIDRSEKALARARVVNRSAIAAGRVIIMVGDIDLSSVEPGGFGRAFAIRVNSFWTRPGLALPHVAASLATDGELWVLYDSPKARIVDTVRSALGASGWRDRRVEYVDGTVAIIARKPPCSPDPV
jgi:SAM-dependent methyltransferase